MCVQRNNKGLKTLVTAICLLSVLLMAPSGLAAPKAELWLAKKDPFLYGACGWCTDFFSLDENQNKTSLTDYNLYTQTGYYLIDLEGPAGTTVTLFGAQNYSLEHGYLILVKKDDHVITVGDLENIPPRQWVTVHNKGDRPGTYSVWYHPAKHFKERIASVRWGQWWSQLPPSTGKDNNLK